MSNLIVHIKVHLYLFYLYLHLYENNVRKCFLKSDFLASCSGIPHLKLLYFRKFAGK